MMCDSHGKGLLKPVIHVPMNPILEEGLPYPDTNAAATLQPNVIRRGQMGAWTNSNHVVRAIGGYTGISSSSIAMKIDSTVKDERLAMSTALAMNHRPDIHNIVRKRYLEMRKGKDELKRLWRHYDFFKPSDDDINWCLEGGSYVHSYDAFSFNRRSRSRDTQDTSLVSEVRPSEKFNPSSLMLILVHPANDYGHTPIKIFDQAKQNEPIFARLFGNLFVHCPLVYSIVLDAIDVGNASSYVVKLAQFVKRCADRGLQGKSESFSKLAKAFDELTLEELTNKGIRLDVPCLFGYF
jgi:hypothetical protein